MSKLVDLLDEDKPIAEQKFVCLSFISPENIIKEKKIYFFEEFTKQYHFNKSAELLTKFANYISYKYNLDTNAVMEDMKEFAKSEEKEMKYNVENDYKNFLDMNEETLELDYSKKHNFQTSVRGIKVRGVFPTQEEAELRCKMLREVDPNHDVYVGPVGLWVPFHPEAYKTGRVEYLEKELNELMHEKKSNELKAKNEFDKRLKESKLKAINENINNAKQNGNKLTQTINEKGELVGIENMSTAEKNLGLNATFEEIKNELFEGDDIVTTQTDHGLGQLLENIEKAKMDKIEEEDEKDNKQDDKDE
jgi:hypothetical protein